MDAKTKVLLPIIYGNLAKQHNRFNKKTWPELDQATDRVLYEETTADVVLATDPTIPVDNVLVPAYESFHALLMTKIALLPEADRLALSDGVVAYQTVVEKFIGEHCLYLDVQEEVPVEEPVAEEEAV